MVNLRWQHIRAVEAGQSQQQEIIRLKQLLQEKDKTEGSYKEKHNQQRRRLCADIRQLKINLESLKSELIASKTKYAVDVGSMSSQFTKLASAINKLSVSRADASDREKMQATELYNLRLKLSEQEQRAKLLSEKSSGDISRLRSEIVSLREAHEKTSAESEAKSKQISLLQDEKQALTEKFDLASSKISTLQKAMKKAQEEERTKYESQLREQTNTLEQYEEHIRSLELSNRELTEENAKLRSEVDRLIAAQSVPKKSQFSKYVDLKVENANLQAKVSEIERRQSMFPARRMSSMPSQERKSSNAERRSTTYGQVGSSSASGERRESHRRVFSSQTPPLESQENNALDGNSVNNSSAQSSRRPSQDRTVSFDSKPQSVDNSADSDGSNDLVLAKKPFQPNPPISPPTSGFVSRQSARGLDKGFPIPNQKNQTSAQEKKKEPRPSQYRIDSTETSLDFTSGLTGSNVRRRPTIRTNSSGTEKSPRPATSEPSRSPRVTSISFNNPAGKNVTHRTGNQPVAVDVGVPLMGKSTRESLRQRSGASNVDYSV